MEDGQRRTRRTTQPFESAAATSATQSSPRSNRQAPAATPAAEDTSYFTPTGRPLRQRSVANLKASSPPEPPAPQSSRPSRSRASVSRTKVKEDSPVDDFVDEEEEEYVDEDAEEEEVMPTRARRSVGRPQRMPRASPSPPRAREEDSPRQRQPSASSPFKVTLGSRARGSTRSSNKRAKLPDEEYAGWMPEIDEGDDPQVVFASIITMLRSWLETNGDKELVDYFEKGSDGITLAAVVKKSGRGDYGSTIEFEKDMVQLFYNARRHFEAGSDTYGGVLTLQRMYNHLTQSQDISKEGIEDEVANRNYASVRYGPCQEQDDSQGEPEAQGERESVSSLQYKGNTISVGNFVHLSNPTDPCRPIIAQIFKTRTEDLGYGGTQDWVTACWFLRPEQTRHPRTMLFWPDEALKTSQFVEHHVEDFIEFICVMYYTRYMKGRPADGEGGWHEGDPLYVCENRFHAEKEQFYKIKNWIGLMPDEVRNKRFDMIEFDEPMAQPTKLKSPFLSGSTGPGSIVDENARLSVPAPPFARSGSSFMDSNSGFASPAPGVSASASLGSIPRIANRTHAASSAVPAAAGATSTMTKITPLFKEYSDEMRAQREAYRKTREEKSKQEEAAAEQAQAQGQVPGEQEKGDRPVMAPVAQAIDRSVSNAMIQMDVPAYYKTLPSETQDLFQQDAESGNVLWYPAPPFLGPSEAKTQRQWNRGERLPVHSLDYLYYLATQQSRGRKRKELPS